MSIVSKTSNLIHNYLSAESVPPDPVQARGRAIYSTGTATNASDDDAASDYHLVDLPSNCILLPDTFFKVDGWGFAQVAIGTVSDTVALVNQTKATEAIVTPIEQGDANHSNRLWKTLGMAADPGGMIGIYAHAAAGATAVGTLPFRIAYLTD